MRNFAVRLLVFFLAIGNFSVPAAHANFSGFWEGHLFFTNSEGTSAELHCRVEIERQDSWIYFRQPTNYACLSVGLRLNISNGLLLDHGGVVGTISENLVDFDFGSGPYEEWTSLRLEEPGRITVSTHFHDGSGYWEEFRGTLNQ